MSGRPVFCFISHGCSGDIKHLKVLCDWLELKTVGPAIVINGKNISSNDIKDIESNIEEMMKII